MHLILVRHPPPLVASGICYGQTDVACSPEVMTFAAQALQHLLPQGISIVCSPLQRCEHLAQALQGLEPDLAYKTDARLAEMHFGAWEMQAWEAIAPSQLQAWTDDFAHFRCGGSGESSAWFVRRVAQCLRDCALAGQDQVWITHAGVMKALQWLQIQPPTWIEALFKALARSPEATCALPTLGDAEHGLWRDQLRARDWPQGALAFGQVQTWDWPQDWQRRWLEG
jgi:alpha-ribazole phosphatase